MENNIKNIFENLSVSTIIKMVILILVSIVCTENIRELYTFLLSIPILVWILDIQILKVVRSMLIISTLMSAINYIQNIYIAFNEKSSKLEERLECIKKALNSVFIFAALIYGLVIIFAITYNLNISIYINFPILIVLIIMVNLDVRAMKKLEKNFKEQEKI